MLTIAEAQQRTELFLTGQMIGAVQAVDYELPSFETETREVQLSDAARARVQSATCTALRMPLTSSTALATNC
jgi:squalene cyclase